MHLLLVEFSSILVVNCTNVFLTDIMGFLVNHHFSEALYEATVNTV